VNAVTLGKQLLLQLIRDDALGLAAELAYRFFLAIFPFFIFLASVGGFLPSLFGLPDPARSFVELFSQIMPPAAAEVFRPEIEYLVGTTRPGLASLSVLGAVMIATSGTNALIKAMNRAYGVEETRPFAPRYLLAIGITVLAGTLTVVAFVLFVAGWLSGVQLAYALGLGQQFVVVVRLLYWPLLALMVVTAIAVLYRAAPNAELKLKWVIPGAVVFTIGWLSATAIFAAYVDNFGNYRFTYGTLGGVVVLLLWFYLTGLFFILGAELNDVVHDQLYPESMRDQRSRNQEETDRHFEGWGLDVTSPGRL
jgi:membrane protein